MNQHNRPAGISARRHIIEATNPDPKNLPGLDVWERVNEEGKVMPILSAAYPNVPGFVCDSWCYENGMDLVETRAEPDGSIILVHRLPGTQGLFIRTEATPAPGVVDVCARVEIRGDRSDPADVDIPALNLCWQLKRAPGFSSKPDLYTEFAGRCFLFTAKGLTYLDQTERLKYAGISEDDLCNNPPWVQAYYPIGSKQTGSRDRFTRPVIGAVSRDRRYLAAIACENPEEMSQMWHDCMHNNPAWLPEGAPSEEQTWRLRIYAMENDPDRLLRYVERDFQEGGDRWQPAK